MSVKDVKVKMTEKGNIKLTLSKRQAQFLLSMLGPTYGKLSYSIYGPLGNVLENPSVFEVDTRLNEIFSDSVLKEGEKQ